MQHQTRDGRTITIGMKVWTYDWCWGTVLDTPENRRILEEKAHVPNINSGTCENAWFEVVLEGGRYEGRTNIYDCSRLWALKQR